MFFLRESFLYMNDGLYSLRYLPWYDACFIIWLPLHLHSTCYVLDRKPCGPHISTSFFILLGIVTFALVQK